VARSVRDRLGAEDRLASARGPLWSVYLDRPVYNLRHAIRRAGRVEAAEAVLDRYGIDQVLLSPADPDDAPLVPYFTRVYGAGSAVGSARLWRVRPRPDVPPAAIAVAPGDEKGAGAATRSGAGADPERP